MHAVTETGPWIELNAESNSNVVGVQALGDGLVLVKLKNGGELTQRYPDRNPLEIALSLVHAVEHRDGAPHREHHGHK